MQNSEFSQKEHTAILLLDYFYDALEFLLEEPREKLIANFKFIEHTKDGNLYFYSSTDSAREKPNDNDSASDITEEKALEIEYGLLLTITARSRYSTNVLQKIQNDILGNNSVEKSIILEFIAYKFSNYYLSLKQANEIEET